MIPIQITLEEKTFTIYIISGYPTRSKYVIRALKSALNQDYSNYNIVLRLGYEIPELEDLIDEKVTISYFDHETIKVGKKLGRNIAESLEFFNDYICFLDDDDFFTPDKLKRINAEFSDDVVYIHNGSTAVDDAENVLYYSNRRDDFNMSSISVAKRAIEKNFFYDLDSSVDTGIYLCAIKNGKLKFIEDKLTYYTIHKSTTMGQGGDFDEWRKKKLFSYKNIIQPTYQYFYEYFKGSNAEIYAKRLLGLNTIFLEIYEENTNSKKISLPNKIKLALVKPYLRSRDKFATKVILASIISKQRVLEKLYANDISLSNKI